MGIPIDLRDKVPVVPGEVASDRKGPARGVHADLQASVLLTGARKKVPAVDYLDKTEPVSDLSEIQVIGIKYGSRIHWFSAVTGIPGSLWSEGYEFWSPLLLTRVKALPCRRYRDPGDWFANEGLWEFP